MFKPTTAVALLGAALVALTYPALAAPHRPPSPPTLHGWCGTGGVSACPDLGSNSPIAQNQLDPFGFVSSPGATGDLILDILVPNNEVVAGGTFSITGGATATAALFSLSAWSNGQLDSYLGITASPTNSFGAFGAGLALSPGASGFFVYQADLGTQTLAGTGGPPNQTFDIAGLPPVGSYLLGFLHTASGFGATANSGAILVEPCEGPSCGAITGGNDTTGSPVPEPASLSLLTVGLAALGLRRRRRS